MWVWTHLCYCLISGSITVDGHELHEEDLRLMYTFDQSSSSAAQYEAHSDAQVGMKFKPLFFFILIPFQAHWTNFRIKALKNYFLFLMDKRWLSLN